MSKESTVLAEPNIEAVAGDKFQLHPALAGTSSILQAAASLASGGKESQQSAGDVLAANLKQQEAKQEKQSAPAQETPPKQETVVKETTLTSESGLPPPNAEVKRAKIAAADEPREPGSALEDFRVKMQEGRNAQFKKFHEDKNEPAKEQKEPTKEPTKQVEDQPVTMEEIDRELNNPALSKRHQERMRFLANQAKRSSELDAKVKDLETKVGSATSSEEFKQLKQQHDAAAKELMQFRRKYELESDPDIKKQFDDVIVQANDAIIDKLKEAGLSDKTLDLIKKAGGFDSFSRSKTVFTVPEINEFGETVEKKVTASELTKNWLQSLPYADSKYIEAKMIESFNLSDSKARRVKELAQEAEKFFKEQSEVSARQTEEQKKQIEENSKKYETWASEWQAKQDWIKERDLSSITNEQERKDAEEDNRAASEARELLAKAYQVKTVEDMTQLVSTLAQTPHLQRSLAKAQRENEALKHQLSQIGNAVRTTPRTGGSSIRNTPLVQREKSASESMKVSAIDAMRESFESMRLGGRQQHNADTE